MFFVISASVAVQRLVRPGGTWNPLRWTIEENPGTSLTWRAAAYLLPAFFLAAMATVRGATKSTSLRRSIGILWDVMTFWPRRFHPLAVRPYAERAVPEFQSRVLEHVRGSARPVLVSAHSQGSVLAFAALAPLDARVTDHVALVSFGCPLGTLFGPLFPAYFGPDQIDLVRAKLMGGDVRGWRNLYRLTDPIGGPVFGDGGDRVVDDPAVNPPREEGPEVPPRERDRQCFMSIAGHSLYERERELKDWVAEVSLRSPR